MMTSMTMKKMALSAALMTATLAYADEPTIQEREGATKGNLGAFRSALSIHYGDFEGRYPTDPSVAMIPKYLAAMPVVDLPGTGHESSSEVLVITGVPDYAALERRLTDSGKWLYVADPSGSADGLILIDCTHLDSRGVSWSKY